MTTTLGGTCPQCGRDNAIVNQCGCDPNNMPTRPMADQSQFAESDARLLATLEAGEPRRQAEYALRRNEQRRERFALSVFKILIGREEGSKLTDYRSMACEAVEAAEELAAMLDKNAASAILPGYEA